MEISKIAPALQFLYLALMYTSAFPLIMSLRQTNVYEERSLGQSDTSKYGNVDDAHGAQVSQVGVCLASLYCVFADRQLKWL